jgi:hypothetical protein
VTGLRTIRVGDELLTQFCFRKGDAVIASLGKSMCLKRAAVGRGNPTEPRVGRPRIAPD